VGASVSVSAEERGELSSLSRATTADAGGRATAPESTVRLL
jgi:hypothetical protein